MLGAAIVTSLLLAASAWAQEPEPDPVDQFLEELDAAVDAAKLRVDRAASWVVERHGLEGDEAKATRTCLVKMGGAMRALYMSEVELAAELNEVLVTGRMVGRRLAWDLAPCVRRELLLIEARRDGLSD